MADDSDRLDVGRVLAATTATLWRDLPLYLTILVLYAAMQTAPLWVFRLPGSESLRPVAVYALPVVQFVGFFWFQGAILHAAIRRMDKGRVSVFGVIGAGFRFLIPLLLLAVLAGISIGLAFLLLIVPGIILALRWSMGAPAIVAEEHFPSRALGRSVELVEDNYWRVFGLALLMQVVFIGANFTLLNAQTTNAFDLGLAVWAGVIAVAGAIEGVIANIGAAAVFVGLRRAREGDPAASVAQVFE